MGWYLFGWVFATILCLLYKVEFLSSDFEGSKYSHPSLWNSHIYKYSSKTRGNEEHKEVYKYKHK